MFSVAAARLEQDYANPQLVADLKKAAAAEAKRRAEGRGWSPEEDKRVERQRTLFVMLPSTNATDRLKEAMMQRVYDLMWDGDCSGADAIAEFLPSADATKAFDAWEHDQNPNEPRSRFYEPH